MGIHSIGSPSDNRHIRDAKMILMLSGLLYMSFYLPSLFLTGFPRAFSLSGSDDLVVTPESFWILDLVLWCTLIADVSSVDVAVPEHGHRIVLGCGEVARELSPSSSALRPVTLFTSCAAIRANCDQPNITKRHSGALHPRRSWLEQ